MLFRPLPVCAHYVHDCITAPCFLPAGLALGHDDIRNTSYRAHIPGFNDVRLNSSGGKHKRTRATVTRQRDLQSTELFSFAPRKYCRSTSANYASHSTPARQFGANRQPSTSTEVLLRKTMLDVTAPGDQAPRVTTAVAATSTTVLLAALYRRQ